MKGVFFSFLLIFLAGCRQAPDNNNSRVIERFPQYNLLMISLDTLRQDRLGVYGNANPLSPFIDFLSRRAVVFPDMFAQSPSTVRSHRAIFTSQYIYDQESPVPAPSETLAGILTESGWHTSAIVDGGLMNRKFGNHTGFEEYDDTGGGFETIKSKTFLWLEKHRQEKFFLFLHTYDIHFPYTPPKPFSEMFMPEGKAWFSLSGEFGPNYFNTLSLAKEDYLFVQGKYDGCVRYCDGVLAELYRTLLALGLEKNTIIIIISDHGESLGERSYIGHNQLYDVQLKVPCIMMFPGIIGKITSGPSETVDILPSLLSLLHVNIPSITQGTDLSAFLFSPLNIPVHRTRLSENVFKSVRKDDIWKLIIRGYPENDELYRIDEDPEEIRNVAEKYPAVMEDLRKAYTSMTKRKLSETRIDKNRTMIQVPLMQAEEEDAKLKEQMRKLGYID